MSRQYEQHVKVIGGPNDGQTVLMDVSQGRVLLPEPPRPLACNTSLSELDRPYKAHSYRVVRLTSNRGELYFF
jgi:hypothetical protein